MASGGRLRRLHGPFVSDREVEDVAAYLKKQGAPEYLEAVTAGGEDGEDGIPGLDIGDEEGSGDPLFDQAVALVARDRKASTSYIQRRLQIGYNRAATLIERMEEEGMIGPADHAGRREIYLPEDEGT
jgi:S-DNA-T family DNA segregation ATPase FtsK/SpoIIIE